MDSNPIITRMRRAIAHRVRRLPAAAARGLVVAALACACFPAYAQTCTFSSTGTALTFPTLDPSAAATATATMDVVVRCIPASITPTWAFSGANGSAPLRMRHATQNAFIPYTIDATRLGGGANEQWRITGTVLGANYANATVGSYSDILTATVTP